MARDNVKGLTKPVNMKSWRARRFRIVLRTLRKAPTFAIITIATGHPP